MNIFQYIVNLYLYKIKIFQSLDLKIFEMGCIF